MEIKFSHFARIAATALLAGSLSAHAENIVPMSKVEALAACTTLVEKIEAYKGAGDLANAKRVVQFCDEGLADIYQNLRLQGSEYFVGGLGVFLGIEGNTPSLKHVAAGMRIALGGSVFLTDAPGMRFTPLVNVVPVTLQGTLKGSPSLIEPQLGMIVYIGSKNTKSISQLNGLYAGGGAEMPNVFASQVQGRSSLTINVLRNVRGNIAIVGMKSFNAGSDMVAGNLQVMSVNNVTRNGEGSSFSALFKGIGGEFIDIVSGATDSIVNFVKSKF